MNIYVNINGKTRYFKSREEANAALGKKPTEEKGKKPTEEKGKKPTKGKNAEGENNNQKDNK